MLLSVMVSCAPPAEGVFDPLVGFEADTVRMDMNLDDAIAQGIVLPAGGAYFHFAFDTQATHPLYYKIYYQNESYKFDEADSLSHENFYGSWEDTRCGFKPVPADGSIRDSFRIVGNPRNERAYFGADMNEFTADEAAIRAVEAQIRNNADWYSGVEEKARCNGYTTAQQLRLDACWVIAQNRHSEGESNHRWKRNPRTGDYSFLLVVADSIGLASIPDYVQHIDQLHHGRHVNPYAWFARHGGRHVTLLRGSKMLHTRAVLTPERGVFIDELSIHTPYDHKEEISGAVGSDSLLARRALFQQFFPSVSQQYTLRNIPLVRDIDHYTMADYLAAGRYDEGDLMDDHPQVSRIPGTTVNLAPDRSYISIVNPGNEGSPHPRKESTGVMTRVGFTYGKYTGKIKFPPMLNADNIWNGLTYAFWLINQEGSAWNNRRPAPHGYIDRGEDAADPAHPVFHPQNHYSEIDIEIMKASPYWPSKDQDEAHIGQARRSSDVVFSCTNWDLANHDPKRYFHGEGTIPYGEARFLAMRWYDTYLALTTKTAVPGSIFDSEYYYYEIEWKPREIIWRLGPDPQHMRVVGYMSDAYTAIPNNQMLCIVTQEYHYSEWWPPVVYQQGLIPYNASDIVGRVYEIVVE